MLLPNLKYYRMLAGYTQQELAEEVGINRVTVANLERGHYHVGPHTLKKLADALGVTTRELVEEDQPTREDARGLVDAAEGDAGNRVPVDHGVRGRTGQGPRPQH